MAKLVGARYAYALFEAGLELNKLEKFKQDLLAITNIMEEEERLVKILSHPKISKDEKKEILSALFEASISREMLNFLYILVDKRREAYLMEIASVFEKMFNEHENIIEITAITAVPLEDESMEKLTTVLSNKMGKKVKLKNMVDKDVIGGVLLKIENKIIDGTIRGQLEAMERTIKNVSL